MNKLYSLQFKTTSDYSLNLQTLISLVEKADTKSIIVAPEVCLTGFDYDNFNTVIAFSKISTKELEKVSQDKVIVTTMIEEFKGEIYNFAKVFYNGEVVYKRAKARLFRFGNEHKYMSEGDDQDIKIIEIDGVKIAILICFELRFKSYGK